MYILTDMNCAISSLSFKRNEINEIHSTIAMQPFLWCQKKKKMKKKENYLYYNNMLACSTNQSNFISLITSVLIHV